MHRISATSPPFITSLVFYVFLRGVLTGFHIAGGLTLSDGMTVYAGHNEAYKRGRCVRRIKCSLLRAPAMATPGSGSAHWCVQRGDGGVVTEVTWCRCKVTLGGDGVLGAGGGGGLGAVAAGVLQGVAAALLALRAQAAGQHHGQVAGRRGHLVPMLQPGTQGSQLLAATLNYTQHAAHTC